MNSQHGVNSNPPKSAPTKALREEINEIVLDCLNTSFNGAVLNPMGHDYKDTAVDELLRLITSKVIEELETLKQNPWVEPVSKSKNVAVERIDARINTLKKQGG